MLKLKMLESEIKQALFSFLFDSLFLRLENGQGLQLREQGFTPFLFVWWAF